MYVLKAKKAYAFSYSRTKKYLVWSGILNMNLKKKSLNIYSELQSVLVTYER